MEIKGLSGTELCAIIKACAESGVSNLELDSLKIQFGNTQSIGGIQAPFEGTQTPSPQTPGTEVEPTPEQIENQFMDALQARAVEDLAQTQTLIDSPVDFENDMVNGLIYENKDGVDVTKESRRTQPAV